MTYRVVIYTIDKNNVKEIDTIVEHDESLEEARKIAKFQLTKSLEYINYEVIEEELIGGNWDHLTTYLLNKRSEEEIKKDIRSCKALLNFHKSVVDTNLEILHKLEKELNNG